MLLLDVNVCLYAYRPNQSETARRVSSWLAPKLVGRERVAVSEPVLASVIRIATHPRIFETPSTAGDVLQFTESLVAAPAARLVRPGPDHWPLFTTLVAEHRLRGNDVSDAGLAAHCLELGATLVTLDSGFAGSAPCAGSTRSRTPRSHTVRRSGGRAATSQATARGMYAAHLAEVSGIPSRRGGLSPTRGGRR